MESTDARRGRVQVTALAAESVADAQRLLCEVYQKELGWNPPEGNPSGLEYRDGKLRDRLETQAVWVGVTDGLQLVACARILTSAVGLELLLYCPDAKVGEASRTTAEVKRLAVRREFRRGPATLLVYLGVHWMSSRLNVSRAYGTVNESTMPSVRAAGWRHTGTRFRYHASDPAEVLLICIDNRPLRSAKMAPGWTLMKLARRCLRLVKFSRRPRRTAA